jgi:hypothetical protein
VGSGKERSPALGAGTGGLATCEKMGARVWRKANEPVTRPAKSSPPPPSTASMRLIPRSYTSRGL